MSFDKEKEQLLMALDLARIGFYDWDVIGNLIYFNTYMLQDWGIENNPPTTLQDAVSSIHPEDQERVSQLVNDALEQRVPYATEYRVLRPDGSIAWMEVKGIVRFNENNSPVRFFGTCINITERKEKAKLLEESEAMIRTFADTMPQMAFIADPTGAITYFNKRWYDYVSTEGTEGWGWKDQPIHHPDDLERTIAIWKDCLATGTPYETDYRLRRHDGQYRWHLGRALPHRNKDGEIIRWCGTNTDIHEERMAFERNRILFDFGVALSRGLSIQEISESILVEGKKILQNIAGLVIVKEEDSFSISAKMNIPDEYTNDKAFFDRVIRLPAKSALFESKNFFLGTQEELLTEFPDYESALKHINAKALVALPLRLQGKAIASVAYFLGEEVQFSTELQRFFESLATQAAVAIDRAMLYEKQLVQKNELEVALSARDEFFSIASHELKTPLTSMRINGQLLLRNHARDPLSLTSEKALNFIKQNDKGVSRLVRLVDDMLDISRIQTGRLPLRPETFDLFELMKDVLSRAAATTEAKLTLTPAAAIYGLWDKLRLEQVLTNLLSNAIRYGNGNPVQAEIRVRSSTVLITIQDSGIGIPDELIHSIFNRYERGPSGDVHGLGLGLYITKQIVESHSGKIWVESQVGLGSTFFVELPHQLK